MSRYHIVTTLKRRAETTIDPKPLLSKLAFESRPADLTQNRRGLYS
jgi:hypothetical protein